MFEHRGKVPIFVTTNAMINTHDELVMGRGAAKQLATLIPSMPGYWGHHIRMQAANGRTAYGVLYDDYHQVGIFQVKWHWKNDADLNLIANSCRCLIEMVKARNWQAVYLNYPGIGNGRLKLEQVEQVVNMLPETVHLWRLENGNA